ncbi:MAG: L-histidine N(alpha)-methyltransferase, partial [Fibrobacter sp.]|nr:L-histidine N(alpha)-methyltransferase [Fibrobacter sp.]
MNLHSQLDSPGNRVYVYNFLTTISKENIVSSILKDLQSKPRKISCKFLYDSKGSRLFKEITKLPEYYLSRIESILI